MIGLAWVFLAMLVAVVVAASFCRIGRDRDGGES